MPAYKATYTQFEKLNEHEIDTPHRPSIDLMMLAILNKDKKRDTEHSSTSSQISSSQEIFQKLKDIGVDPESITIL